MLNEKQLATVVPIVLRQRALVTQCGMVGVEWRGTSAKHDLSLNTNASFDLPRLLGDLNNQMCLSTFLNRLSLLLPT